MEYDSLLNLVKKRRSIRRFKPDLIPDGYVEKIIEVARWAPSAFNTQPWEFIVVKDQGYKDTIAGYVTRSWAEAPTDDVGDVFGGLMDYSNAPVFILLYGDLRTKVGLPDAAQGNESYEFEKLFNSSLASAFLYMHLAATSLGLASQWVSLVGIPHVDTAIKKLLGITEGLRAYDMMAVGYSAAEPRPKFIREKESMIHYDYCGTESFRNDAEVADYARRTKSWTTATCRRLR